MRGGGGLGGGEAFRGVAHAEDVEVFEAGFEDIDELVVAVGVGGHEEEAVFEDVVAGVADDAFDDLAVVEVDAHPEALHDGGVFVEVEGAVAQVAVEGLDEEDGLGVFGGDVFDLVGVEQLERDRVQGILGVVAQELFDGAEFADVDGAFDRVVLVPDDDLVLGWGIGFSVFAGYA